MAGRYINTNFWKDSYIVDLQTDEKLLFLYLLTNHMTNIAGIYELSVREMAFDTDIDKSRIQEILNKFIKDGKIEYINGWVALNNWIKHQSQNPKVVTGIHRIVENLPTWLREHLLEPDNPQSSLLEDRQSKPIDRQSKPIALNLTKLNLTKPYGTAEAGGSKEPGENSKPSGEQYRKAVEADKQLESRKRKTFERTATKPTKAGDVDPYALREGRKK